MHGRIILGVFLVAAAGWSLYRLLTHKPIVPYEVIKALRGVAEDIGSAAGFEGSESDPEYLPQDIAGDDAGLYQFDDATAGNDAPAGFPIDPDYIPYAENAAVRDVTGEGFDLSFFKQKAVPIAVGATAAGATIAAQRARAKAKKIPVTQQRYVTEKSGLVKRSEPTKVSSPSSAKPKKVGTTLPKTQGTGRLRIPTTVQKVATTPLTRAAALAGGKAAIPTVAKVASVAGRVAGRVFLPLAVGLSAYDLAVRAQEKGAANLTAQDVAAAATGLGGLGLSKYVPEQAKAILGTKLVDVPNSIAQASGNLSSVIYNYFGGR